MLCVYFVNSSGQLECWNFNYPVSLALKLVCFFSREDFALILLIDAVVSGYCFRSFRSEYSSVLLIIASSPNALEKTQTMSTVVLTAQPPAAANKASGRARARSRRNEDDVSESATSAHADQPCWPCVRAFACPLPSRAFILLPVRPCVRLFAYCCQIALTVLGKKRASGGRHKVSVSCMLDC